MRHFREKWFLALVCLTLSGLGLSAWFFGDEGVGETPSHVIATSLVDAAASKASSARGGFGPLPVPQEIDERKARLGHDLFKDTRFSATNSVSCQSCHDLNSYGADNKPFSVGIAGRLGDSNSPTVFNAKNNFRQFWDGRARTLNEQIDGPVHNPKELGSNWKEVVEKLGADQGYVQSFARIYGRKINRDDVIDAITVFEMALSTPDAPFDQYLRGDAAALSRQQIAGFEKFQNFGCVACHQGAGVGGNMFQTLGIMGDYFADRGGSYASDAGRFALTKAPRDLHLFRVPSLRNVGQTAPYFHDGQVKDLDQAVRLMGKYQLGRDLTSQDVSDLVSFLHSLTGSRPKILIEKRSPSNAVAH